VFDDLHEFFAEFRDIIGEDIRIYALVEIPDLVEDPEIEVLQIHYVFFYLFLDCTEAYLFLAVALLRLERDISGCVPEGIEEFFVGMDLTVVKKDLFVSFQHEIESRRICAEFFYEICWIHIVITERSHLFFLVIAEGFVDKYSIA